MAHVKRIQFSIDIAAPAARVYELMIGETSYVDWTSAFGEGSHYQGSWQSGDRIRFLGSSGEGMVAEIAENRPHEFISIRHLGFVMGGVEDTDSEAVRRWAPAYENYTFVSGPEGTKLVVDLDAMAEIEHDMLDAWPRALERLKALCERP